MVIWLLGWQNESETSRIGLAFMITDTFLRIEAVA